ncbi:vitamin B12 dependent methionine synthase activation region [Clostridium sp. CAG:1013]|nr:vitamin B12 dependent methionine synthase activation region [Clostridium sp. CAG:1013]
MEKQEILRYLGAGNSDPQLDLLIARAEKELIQAAMPRYVSGKFSLSVRDDGAVIGGTYLPSKTLAAHLKGCQEAFLVAFTLGPGVDALIRRYELVEMSLVPVLQACAAVYTEEQADQAQEDLETYAKEKGLFLRPRYSPGYGDLPLSSQRFLFDALQVSKKIGVTLTDTFLMLPMKSITGVVGLSKDPSLCHVDKCMSCSAKNCPFRKGEENDTRTKEE